MAEGCDVHADLERPLGRVAFEPDRVEFESGGEPVHQGHLHQESERRHREIDRRAALPRGRLNVDLAIAPLTTRPIGRVDHIVNRVARPQGQEHRPKKQHAKQAIAGLGNLRVAAMEGNEHEPGENGSQARAITGHQGRGEQGLDDEQASHAEG